MVHGALIEAGKVEKLTFKQLRTLERIDAKKARDLKVLELTNNAVEAAGRVGQGIFQGTITGPIALILILSATYPAWLPPVEAAAAALANAIANAWKQTAASPAPPPPPLNMFDGGQGNFGVHWDPQLWVSIVESLGGIPTAGGTQWFQTAAERDADYTKNVNNGAVNWYWAFTKVNR